MVGQISRLIKIAASLERSKPAWDEYFLSVALLTSTRSDCLRRQIGCVAVSPDRRIIATGYNAPPHGVLSYAQRCQLAGTTPDPGCCKADKPAGSSYDNCNAIHAEANCLLRADWQRYDYIDLYIAGRNGYNGELLDGLEPCIYCARLIRNTNTRHIITIKEGLIKYIYVDELRLTVDEERE